jgi:23S rRNA (guanosine2251-2'-O)-methyltransferase
VTPDIRRRSKPTGQLPEHFAYGINPVKEALIAGALTRLFTAATESDRLSELRELAKQAGVTAEPLEEAKWFGALARLPHQGAAGIIKPFRGLTLGEVVESLPPTAAAVLLDGVNDPQNLGSVIRTAAAAGAAIVLPKHGVPEVNATVHKVAAGTTFRARIVLGENLSQAVRYLKDQGFWVAALSAHEGEDAFTFEYPQRTAFVIGSEERGVKRKLVEHSDYRLNIPMEAGVESLNMGVSAAIALFLHRAYWARRHQEE